MSVTKSEGTGGKTELLAVVVHKDEKGYGMTVSGNDPVIVQSVVKHGAAWRAGVRYGDRLLRVNGTSVETSIHQEVVDMIKSSNSAELCLQRSVTTSKITAPLPVDRERQRMVEHTKIQTFQRMLESEMSHIEHLRSTIARGGSDRIPELETAEIRKAHLQQQIDKLGQSSVSTLPNRVIVSDIDPPVTPPRQSFLSNLPRSLSSLTGQSLRGNRHSQPPVTCLDGAPPPLPPRTPNTLSPGSLSPRGPSPGGQVPRPPPVNMSSRHMEPNSISVQMNYPLVAVTHPPIQSGGMGHQRSRSSPEQLGKLNSSTDKEWEMVVTPPGTPPPPYPSTPLPQVPVEPQRPIISMEEEDSPWPIIRSSYFKEDFSNVDMLSPARMAVFLNWIIGERRPPQAALLYLLSATYSSGPSDFLARWAYELHSAFLVPEAPLSLRSVDESIAKEIDDILINETNKDVLKKIFLKARDKAKDELNQQLNEFQLKRQSGLGSFYGPADSVLEHCDHDKQKELIVITDWLLPQLNNWLKESMSDSWDATLGSSTVSILAAAVHPLLRHFGFKSHTINDIMKSPTQGSPPRPEFLQPHKQYKQRVTYLKKSTANPLIIRGHHLSPTAVESVSHCHHCQLLIWGIAPQAYICSDCKLLIHRSCFKVVDESCCGPVAQPTRKSRLMDKLASPALTSNIGNSHQHIDPNQHFYHHHHHDKKQRKSLGTSHFLNIERSSKRFEEDGHAVDMSASYHHPDFEYDISALEEHQQDHDEKVKVEDEEENKDNFALKEVDATIVFTDSECESDKKKKNKTKHRKTMSVSNTIELVRSMGDEWIEAAKREIGEHSKKRENLKKKKEAGVVIIDANHTGDSKKHDKNHPNPPVEHNDVVLLLSDATIVETDEFEVVEPCTKICKKKDTKIKEMAPKICSSQIMHAQKMGVKMIAKASSVGALNFMRRKRPVPIVGVENSAADHVLLSTALFIDSERTHSDMVRTPDQMAPVKKHDASDASTNSGDEIDGEIFYDAKANASQEESETADEEPVVKKTSSKSESKKVSKQSSDPKVMGLRSRKTLGGSLKRTGGGRRKVKRRSSTEEAPPLPPKGFVPPPPPPKPSHWLFGNSFKGENRRDADDSGADSSHHTDSSHLQLEHSLDIADNSKHSVRPRPVTKAESFRDRAAKVQRTKRKTSDPNQLTSGNAFNDAEGPGILGAPSGGSSSSSLSSRSNESAGQIDNQDSHLEASEEEESAEPWSTKASADIVGSMTLKARKRQDLIHELITSEISHVRWLRILRQVFYNPLQQSPLLPANELKGLFPNLHDVLQRHRKLCSDLKALSAASPIIQNKPLADALIMTLGESKYPSTLAKFCGGQRLALDALRERRRRAKELHTFLAKLEQDPLCARLRLQDFLAFVWQRLTKYQLLLEGIIKTGKDEEDEDVPNAEDEGLTRLNQALDIAKEVLNTVNTTIKTTENVHRLKTIQSKLEVRGVGSAGSETEPGELKRMDLMRHSLVMEGTLSIRQDSTKRITVLALLLGESLVLLQREADKYILRPIPQATHPPLSPIVRWDTVFFRPNAAIKNGFFLVNINGIQMYELSAASSSEYNTWTRYISESAKALGPRSGTVEEGPPPPLPANPPPTPIPSSDVTTNGTSEPNTSIEEDKEEPPEPPKNEDDGKQISGAVQTVEGETSDTKGPSNISTIIEELIIPSSVAVTTPPVAFTAQRLLTPEERFRQAEEKVSIALREAAEAAKETAEGDRLSIYSAMESLIGKPASVEQRRASLDNGLDHETIQEEDVQLSTTHLLLTAQAHVDNLTEVLLRALRVSSAECSMTKCTLHTSHGLCDTCSVRHSKYSSTATNESVDKVDNNEAEENATGEDATDLTVIGLCNTGLNESQTDDKFESIVLLEEVGESSTDPYIADPEVTNLVTTSAIGLRQILTTLMGRLPAVEKEREFLRARLQQTNQRLHRLHHLHKDCVISENSSGSSIDTVQEVPNSNSTDQSGGEG